MSLQKESHWIPLADLMTVLMVIFLFLSVLFIKKSQQVAGELNKSKEEIVTDFKTVFKQNLDPKSNEWHAVLDVKNLSIKFVDESLLFTQNDASLKPEFKVILSDFLPKFLRIVLDKKYRNQIAEVRIEGHTSPEGGYMYNLRLSQERTANVMEFLLSQPYFNQLPIEDRRYAIYLLTANGLSSGRAINNTGEVAFTASDKEVNWNKSRRVEFRVVMNSQKLLDSLKNDSSTIIINKNTQTK